jgi:hypothetical protein
VSASDRSSELRLPTKVVAVRLALVGGMPSAAEVFIADVARRGRGRGHLLDDLAAQLGAEASFMPVRWSNRVRLLGKHAIAWIAVPRGDLDDSPSIDSSAELSEEELTLYDREHRVEIELVHGTKLIGTLLDSSPMDRTRVIDHLNRAGRFLRLWTTHEHFLINTTQVVAVTELGEAK